MALRRGQPRAVVGSGGAAMTPRFQLTVFEKEGGPLTKRISLVDGKLKSDSSDCRMNTGHAFRLPLTDIGALADEITKFESNEALGLGTLRQGVEDGAKIVTKRYVNGDPSVIARTADNFLFRPGKPGAALLDFDTTGMPEEIAERIDELGGFENALASILAELSQSQRLSRASTSAG